MHGIRIGQDPGAAGNNSLHQPAHIIVMACLGQNVIENRMIDGREVLDNIETQHIAMAAREVLQSIHGAVRAFPDAVGITVGNKTALEPGLDDVAQGMVHNPVTEGCGADFPLLGFMDVEMQIGARLIAMAVQSRLEFQQVIRQLMLEARGAVQATLATCGFAVGLQQVIPGDDTGKGLTV